MAVVDIWTIFFIERLWLSLKQEAIYLHKLTDGYRA